MLARFGADDARVREQVVRLLTGEGEQGEQPGPQTRREQEWMADVDVAAVVEENQRLHREVERLRELLRQHGIQPNGGDGSAQTA